MTIRAKLYFAILLTVIGPVITIAVALHGMDRLGDRFDEVQDRSQRQALALDLKFDVTDFNGWQTAYGYDNGASRPRFESSVRRFRGDLATARNGARPDRRETRAAERHPRPASRTSWRSTTWPTRALKRGDHARVKRIFLGPELRLFDAMAVRSEQLARYEARRATATQETFDDAREDSRRGLIAVALGAALVIILLLVTAADIARLALESHRVRE